MERALPMNEEENLLWEKWKESGFQSSNGVTS